jgi:hypothetical protein
MPPAKRAKKVLVPLKYLEVIPGFIALQVIVHRRGAEDAEVKSFFAFR